MEQKKYHYFYKITNIVNGFYYYGIHSTDNLDDGYMGSGRRLKRAVKKFGKENFQKEILKFFESREDASKYEEETVNESCVKDVSCYNLKRGGDYGLTYGTLLVKDKNGKFFRCKPDDEDYLNGYLVPFMTGVVNVINLKTGKSEMVSVEEYSSNKLLYKTPSSGKISVKDENGNCSSVSVFDEKYLNGNLVPIWKGRHHTSETKEKMSLTHKENKDQIGEKNSQYGTCWITKNGVDKKIKKEETEKYLEEGWKRGRFVNETERISKFDNLNIEEIKRDIKNNIPRSTIFEKYGFSMGSYYRYRKKHNI